MGGGGNADGKVCAWQRGRKKQRDWINLSIALIRKAIEFDPFTGKTIPSALSFTYEAS